MYVCMYVSLFQQTCHIKKTRYKSTVNEVQKKKLRKTMIRTITSTDPVLPGIAE